MVIPFESEYRKKFYELEEKIFDSNFWSEGQMQRTFEEKFGEYTKLGAKAISSAGAGLLAVLEYVDVRGYDVNIKLLLCTCLKKIHNKLLYSCEYVHVSSLSVRTYIMLDFFNHSTTYNIIVYINST